MKEKTALRNLASILFIGLMPCEITGNPISHTIDIEKVSGKIENFG